MEVEIQTIEGIFLLLKVPEAANVVDLTNLAEKENGVPASETMVQFMGCLLDEEDLLLPVADYLALGNITFTFLNAKNGIKRNTTKDLSSDIDVDIITGSSRKFKWRKVFPNRQMKFKLPSSKFGLVYHKEGEEEGKRIFHVEVFDVVEEGSIQLRTKEGETIPEVFLIPPEHPEKPEQKLCGIQKTYDENDRRSMLDTAVKVSKIFGSFFNLGSILQMIFGGAGETEEESY